MPALLINGETRRFDAESISLGRGSENAVSLPHDARLAPVHAILKRVAGRWIVEAQGEGQISVGEGRPTRFAWIQPGDVIHLTPAGPEVVFDPGAAPTGRIDSTPTRRASEGTRASAPQPSSATAARSADPADRRWIVGALGTGIAAFLLISIGILLGGRSTPPAPPAANHSDVAEGSPAPAPKAGNAGVPALPAGDPRNSVFRLELQTTDKTRAVQLGTAWAVGPRRLVTTGDAARGIALNQEFYPTAVARHSLTREPYEVVRMVLHPQYETAAGRLDQAVRNIQRLKADYDQAKELDERRELEKLLREQDQAAILAAEEAINVNVAILDVGSDLQGTLSWNDAPASEARVGQKLTLVGHPLSQVDFLVDPDHPVPPEKREGRLRHAESPSDRKTPGRWLVGFDDPLKDQNWSGSPLLDSEGVVVGVYSRRTPPLPGAPAGAIVTHDVTVLEGLKALIKNR